MVLLFKSIFLILIMCSALSGRNLVSLWYYGNSIYFLDGFDKMIRIFDPDLKELRSVSVRNISASGSFDFFSVHDPYRSYLNDAASGIIWQLDGDFEVKNVLDVKKSGHELLHSVFPHDYNSLIAGASDFGSVFIIRNSIFTGIVTSDELFKDIWAAENNIYLLYREKVKVYSTEGIFRSEIPLDREYIKIRTAGDRIFLLSERLINCLNIKTREFREFHTGVVLDFCVSENRLFYLTADTRELKSEDL